MWFLYGLRLLVLEFWKKGILEDVSEKKKHAARAGTGEFDLSLLPNKVKVWPQGNKGNPKETSGSRIRGIRYENNVRDAAAGSKSC